MDPGARTAPNLAATTVQPYEPEKNPSIDPARKGIPTQGGNALVPLRWIRAHNPLSDSSNKLRLCY